MHVLVQDPTAIPSYPFKFCIVYYFVYCIVLYCVVVLSFSQSSYGIMEDDGSVTLVILLSEASLVQFEVEVNTKNVTAIGNN